MTENCQPGQRATFGNGYPESGLTFDRNASLRFIRKWKTLLLVVFVVAFVVSLVVSFLITPRYEATATLFPSNSNRLSKAIMDYHYSHDFMDYGAERDCEYAIQVLTSESMMRDVCDRFNLMEHYEISADDPHKFHKLGLKYRGNVNVERTEFLGVEVSVTDVDPQFAADMANFIAANYDTICHRIHHRRAADAADIMQSVCAEMELQLAQLQDSLRTHPQYAEGIKLLIAEKCHELADLQTRATQTRVDMGKNICYKYLIDEARVPDMKAYPKRVLIIALGSLGALLFCILVLLLLDYAKPEEPSSTRKS